MICNVLGKSVTVKALFTYINHERRSERHSFTKFSGLLCTSLPLIDGQNPLGCSETFLSTSPQWFSVINYFPKKLHLTWLIGFQMHF